MWSEKPYTKSENVILRFLWYLIKERMSIRKKIVSKAQFYTDEWRSNGQSCKKLISRKKCLKFFFHDM